MLNNDNVIWLVVEAGLTYCLRAVEWTIWVIWGITNPGINPQQFIAPHKTK